MFLKRRLHILICCAIFSAIACSKKSSTGKSTQIERKIRWATAKPLESLDWNLVSDPATLQQAAFLMEGLTDLHASSEVVPKLAEKITIKTFHRIGITLKKGVRWTNGEELQAKHFIFAWRRLLENAKRASGASLLYSITNAKAFAEGKASFSNVGIRSPSPYELELNVIAGTENLTLANLSHPATWPIISPLDSKAVSATLGPYRVEQHHSGGARYRRYQFYYGTPAPVDIIQVSVVAHAGTRVHLFFNHEADVVDDVPESLIPSLENNAGLSTLPLNRVGVLLFNPSKRLFQEPSLRLAFEKALDRTELISALKPAAVATHRLTFAKEATPNWYPSFNPNFSQKVLAPLKVEPFAFRARDASGLRPFARPTLMFNAASALGVAAAENLQAQWIKNFDFKVELMPELPRGEKELGENSSALHLVEISVTPARGTQSFESLLRYFVSLDTKEGRELQADKLRLETVELEKREKLIFEIEEKLISKYSLALPLYRTAKNALVSPGVKNLTASPWEIWDVSKMTLN